MRSTAIQRSFLFSFVLFAFVAKGAIHYVDVNGTNAVPPYTNWDTAAVTIQDAENASTSGDEIVVTNGVYQTGGTSDSRIAIFNASYVHSVNGPEVTIIRGYQPPGTTNGAGAIRCATLRGVTLAGFTLTNGAAQGFGGGVSAFNSSTVVSNCIIVGNAAGSAGGVYLAKLINCTVAGNLALGGYGGGTASSTMLNCLLVTNTAMSSAFGGGAYQGTLTNCVLSGNSARSGGGARLCNLYGCLLSNNIAITDGGGAEVCVLENCTLIKNSAQTGGGASQCSLKNCLLNGNFGLAGSPPSHGGGADGCALTNCVLIGNSASLGGGACFSSYAVNCTVVSNTAGTGGGFYHPGGPSADPQIVNSIVYFNAATNSPDTFSYGAGYVLRWCCTPLQSGPTIVTNEPHFVNIVNGDFRLLADSPCINAGRNSYMTNSSDLDGNPRIAGGTVDIGAYEFQNSQSVISYGWLQNHGLPTDGSADFADSDGDGMNNWQEWVTNTDPTNSLSYLHMLSTDPTNNAVGVTFHWQSAAMYYFLQRSTNLVGPFATIATNFFAAAGTATYRDATATNAGPYFYRVGVQP